MMHDEALDLEAAGIDGVIFRNSEELVLEFFD